MLEGRLPTVQDQQLVLARMMCCELSKAVTHCVLSGVKRSQSADHELHTGHGECANANLLGSGL